MNLPCLIHDLSTRGNKLPETNNKCKTGKWRKKTQHSQSEQLTLFASCSLAHKKTAQHKARTCISMTSAMSHPFLCCFVELEGFVMYNPMFFNVHNQSHPPRFWMFNNINEERYFGPVIFLCGWGYPSHHHRCNVGLQATYNIYLKIILYLTYFNYKQALSLLNTEYIQAKCLTNNKNNQE